MSIISRKRFGAIIRMFAKTPDQVAAQVASGLELITRMLELEDHGKPLYGKILVLIPRDGRFPDCDCGETAAVLRKTLGTNERVTVQEFSQGDLFCAALNYGVAKLLRDRCDYVTIISHGAKDYLSIDEVKRAAEAFERGARVHGLAFSELTESVLEGRVANTFATWDAVALMSVGGFDLRATQPMKDDPTALYARGWSKEKGAEVFYPQAGVEEIIPLIRLVQVYGPCIAPMTPLGEAQWKVPDPKADPEGYSRHLKKMGTKRERQAIHAAAVNADLSVLLGGIMPAYRSQA